MEERIYAALHADKALKERGIVLPEIRRITPETLLVADAGSSFADALHFGSVPIGSLDVLFNVISTRAAVTSAINNVITTDDASYLTAYNHERLLASLQRFVLSFLYFYSFFFNKLFIIH